MVKESSTEILGFIHEICDKKKYQVLFTHFSEIILQTVLYLCSKLRITL